MGVLEAVCIKQGDGSGILLIAIPGCLSIGSMASLALNLLCNKSRMMREYHVRFRERFGVKLPLPTRPKVQKDSISTGDTGLIPATLKASS